MDLWYPPDDQAPLLEWWTPLVLASAAARRARVPWLIHVDEFELQGRIDRAGRPDVWVYRHQRSGQELYLDATGQAYKFTRTPNGRSYGRFSASDLRSAIHRAGLPLHVEPMWFEEPMSPAGRYAAPPLPLDGYDDEAWPGDEPSTHHATRHATRRGTGAPVGPPPPEPTRPRRRPRPGARRGHLTLIQGGRQAG
jgi:hypothetical protein